MCSWCLLIYKNVFSRKQARRLTSTYIILTIDKIIRLSAITALTKWRKIMSHEMQINITNLGFRKWDLKSSFICYISTESCHGLMERQLWLVWRILCDREFIRIPLAVPTAWHTEPPSFWGEKSFTAVILISAYPVKIKYVNKTITQNFTKTQYVLQPVYEEDLNPAPGVW